MTNLYVTRRIEDGVFEAMQLPDDKAVEKMDLASRIAAARYEVCSEFRESLILPDETHDQEMAQRYASIVRPLERMYQAITGPIERIMGAYEVGKIYNPN